MNVTFPDAENGFGLFGNGQRMPYEPLDLSDDAVAAYWKNHYPNVAVRAVLSEMDSKDTWSKRAFHDMGVVADLTRLLDELANTEVLDDTLINRIPDLVLIAAYLKASQCLRLMKWLETERPQVAGALIQYLAASSRRSETNETGFFLPEAMILHRLKSFKQLTTLQNIFSKERMAAVNESYAAFEKNEYPELNEQSTT